MLPTGETEATGAETSLLTERWSEVGESRSYVTRPPSGRGTAVVVIFLSAALTPVSAPEFQSWAAFEAETQYSRSVGELTGDEPLAGAAGLVHLVASHLPIDSDADSRFERWLAMKEAPTLVLIGS